MGEIGFFRQNLQARWTVKPVNSGTTAAKCGENRPDLRGSRCGVGFPARIAEPRISASQDSTPRLRAVAGKKSDRIMANGQSHHHPDSQASRSPTNPLTARKVA